VLGAALDSKEECQAEEQHEGCAEEEVQGSDGDEQEVAAPGRGANGAQNVPKRVQQQGETPEQARDDGGQVLWAVASAPDWTKDREAPLNADGGQKIQAGAIHEKIQEEEYPKLHPYIELHQVLNCLNGDAEEIPKVGSGQVQDVDSEVVSPNAEAKVPQDHAISHHPKGSADEAEALHELEDSIGCFCLSLSPALISPRNLDGSSRKED